MNPALMYCWMFSYMLNMSHININNKGLWSNRSFYVVSQSIKPLYPHISQPLFFSPNLQFRPMFVQMCILFSRFEKNHLKPIINKIKEFVLDYNDLYMNVAER